MTCESFARELRRQCARFSSISWICEATRINRQQFNKYLAGQTLPSARNLRKICAFFGISEAQLLTGETGAQPAADVAKRDPFAKASTQGMFEIDLPLVPGLELAPGRVRVPPDRRRELPTGHYECYFPLQARPDLVKRALLSLRCTAEGLVFTRRTLFRPFDGNARFDLRARHSGMVLRGAREVYFIGGNTLPPYQPSVLAVGAVPVVGRNYFTGIVTMRGQEGIVAAGAALRYIGTSFDARQALAGLGMVALADPALDPIIAQLMQARTADGHNQIRAASRENLPAAAIPGGLAAPSWRTAFRLVG